MLALLSSRDRQYRTVLIEISRTGAKLRGAELPGLGEQVSFRANDVQAFAEVVWREADLCAIEFVTPIAVDEVKRLQLVPRKSPTCK